MVNVTMACIVICRHAETEKNRLNIHGSSSLDSITALGKQQARRLAVRINRLQLPIRGITATKTSQAIQTAKLVAELASIPYEEPLMLEPFDIGIASGISTSKLQTIDPISFESLDKFRCRIINAGALQIAGAETARELERRLHNWWRAEGNQRCTNRIVIGSSSTVLMLSHYLDRIFPTSDQYRYLATPNGSLRVWTRNESDQQWKALPQVLSHNWPEVEVRQANTPSGNIAWTLFMPGWDVRRTGIAIIPGYFGSSRHGPYGLYNRLARQWSYLGFPTATIDPLGTGDSTPVFRTFDTEMMSVTCVGKVLLDMCDRVIFVGHSMGAATALAASNYFGDQAIAWCLAPLCTLEDMSKGFLNEHQLREFNDTGMTLRHGLTLYADMIQRGDATWRALGHTAKGILIAEADPYTKGQKIPNIKSGLIHKVLGADHNFSMNDSFAQLMKIKDDLLFDEL